MDPISPPSRAATALRNSLFKLEALEVLALILTIRRSSSRSFRYLTFDCYGTLIDWKTGIERSLEDALGKLPGRRRAMMDAYLAAERQEEEGSYKKYREVLRKTALRLSGTFGREVSDAAARRFAASVPSWPAFPDTAKALHELGTMGYQKYILSNVDTDLLEGTIRQNRLEVDGFVTAETVGSYKPARAHWERFLDMTGANRGEVLHIAQSIYHDIVPAGSLGIPTAWINRYGEPLPPGIQPVYLSDNLAHLTGLLAPIARRKR